MNLLRKIVLDRDELAMFRLFSALSNRYVRIYGQDKHRMDMFEFYTGLNLIDSLVDEELRTQLKVCVVVGCLTPREIDVELADLICDADEECHPNKEEERIQVRTFIRSLRRACEFEGMRGPIDASIVAYKAGVVFTTTI